MNTANKRASSINVGLPFGRVLPIPDGTIAAADRASTARSYYVAASAAFSGLIRGIARGVGRGINRGL